MKFKTICIPLLWLLVFLLVACGGSEKTVVGDALYFSQKDAADRVNPSNITLSSLFEGGKILSDVQVSDEPPLGKITVDDGEGGEWTLYYNMSPIENAPEVTEVAEGTSEDGSFLSGVTGSVSEAYTNFEETFTIPVVAILLIIFGIWGSRSLVFSFLIRLRASSDMPWDVSGVTTQYEKNGTMVGVSIGSVKGTVYVRKDPSKEGQEYLDEIGLSEAMSQFVLRFEAWIGAIIAQSTIDNFEIHVRTALQNPMESSSDGEQMFPAFDPGKFGLLLHPSNLPVMEPVDFGPAIKGIREAFLKGQQIAGEVTAFMEQTGIEDPDLASQRLSELYNAKLGQRAIPDSFSAAVHRIGDILNTWLTGRSPEQPKFTEFDDGGEN